MAASIETERLNFETLMKQLTGDLEILKQENLVNVAAVKNLSELREKAGVEHEAAFTSLKAEMQAKFNSELKEKLVEIVFLSLI